MLKDLLQALYLHNKSVKTALSLLFLVSIVSIVIAWKEQQNWLHMSAEQNEEVLQHTST